MDTYIFKHHYLITHYTKKAGGKDTYQIFFFILFNNILLLF